MQLSVSAVARKAIYLQGGSTHRLTASLVSRNNQSGCEQRVRASFRFNNFESVRLLQQPFSVLGVFCTPANGRYAKAITSYMRNPVIQTTYNGSVTRLACGIYRIQSSVPINLIDRYTLDSIIRVNGGENWRG